MMNRKELSNGNIQHEDFNRPNRDTVGTRQLLPMGVAMSHDVALYEVISEEYDESRNRWVLESVRVN